MKFVLFFLILSIHVSAQDLKYIPDVNLRNALIEQGFTTNDSLDLDKIRGRTQLNLNGKGIVNLDGLQYFRIWSLMVYNNEIENLDHLPPNLKTLGCFNNKIKEIKNLPKKLEVLYCGKNEIKEIKNLPKKLKRLDCSYNQISLIENLSLHLKHLNFCANKMTYLPDLPVNIEFVNYAANPIPFDSLPLDYQNFHCDNRDVDENCLPFERVKWNILNSNMEKLPQNITGMRIETGWWDGKTEIFDFKAEGSKLLIDSVKIIRKYRDSTNIKYVYNKYGVDVDKVMQILSNIYDEKMSFSMPRQQDTVKVDMSKEKVFYPGFTCGESAHNWGYIFNYIIYTDTDTLEIRHGFSGSKIRHGFMPCYHTTHNNIKHALDWFYTYQLVNLMLKKHKFTEEYFNEEKLELSLEVVKKTKKKGGILFEPSPKY